MQIKKSDLFTYVPPKVVRLCASSVCQLSCPGCQPHTIPEKKNGILGWGHLKAADFAAFIRSNPSIKTIEISHSGEIFLNSELGVILKDAFEQGVTLTAWTGVNLNKISEQTCEDLVKYLLYGMRVAIDGADQKAYAEYRRGGNFTNVINNIKRINFYKEKYNSPFPQIEWQFIPFSHNEHQILKAKRMAEELNMKFTVKFNIWPKYAPIKSKELVRWVTSSPCATMEDRNKIYGVSGLACHELWSWPQINWDGMMIGCGNNYFSGLGNVFKDGLENVMKGRRFTEMKKAVLGVSVPGEDIPCRRCPVYLSEVAPKDRIKSTIKSILSPHY